MIDVGQAMLSHRMKNRQSERELFEWFKDWCAKYPAWMVFHHAVVLICEYYQNQAGASPIPET